jgi:hypothetical protein
MNIDNGDCFIFIGGAPRSGTTLLQNMLDSHPEIFGGAEFLHVPDIINLRNRFKTSIDREYIGAYCSQTEVDQEIKRLIERFLMPAHLGTSARYLSEKTPGNILVFSELAEIFPNAKFIEIVRDPRATVSSLLQVGKRAKEKKGKPVSFARDARAASAYVMQCIEAGRQAEDKYPGRILTVKYENLVADPRKVLDMICEYLTVDFNESMLFPAAIQHAGETAITEKSGEIWYDKKSYNLNPHTDSLDKWRQILSPSDEMIIYNASSNCIPLQGLGYRLSKNDLPLSKRLRGSANILVKTIIKRVGAPLARYST